MANCEAELATRLCEPGNIVWPDGGRCEVLLPSDWDKAATRFPNPFPDWRVKHAIACNVEITGTKPIRKNGDCWLRGKLTWVGDGELDVVAKCLVRVDFYLNPMKMERHLWY